MPNHREIAIDVIQIGVSTMCQRKQTCCILDAVAVKRDQNSRVVTGKGATDITRARPLYACIALHRVMHVLALRRSA